MSTIKIGLITTLNTNIGDDLIRVGIGHILAEVFRDRTIEYVMVNKHKPLSVYEKGHPIHLAEMAHALPRGGGYVFKLAERLGAQLQHSRFDQCDLIVQCGAPVFWPGCHNVEWAEPLWKHVVGRLAQRIPVFNLAAGSAYPWQAQPTVFEDEADKAYAADLLGYCQLTTVRDRLAKKLCDSLGSNVPQLPCTAFLSSAGQQMDAQPDKYILINYMAGGGHFKWNQPIDSARWQGVVSELIAKIGRRHKVGLLCHNGEEYELAEKLAPSLPRFLPQSPQEFMAVASTAKAALCNRMHAAVGLASMGVPSIAVCTDTRLLMLETLGLPHYYVEETSVGQLEAELESLVADHEKWHNQLDNLRIETCQKYISLVENTLTN
ncbi:MAG: polysaccharide pyruvyl transferase family protein [Caldilineaceae bacterium]|nr:polysaccharide pyruvyl transferase family protein [Caldilineaceae bacterium]